MAVLLDGEIGDGVVRLRPVVRSDGPEILSIISEDPEISRWTRIPWPYTQQHCDEFVDLVEAYHSTSTDLVCAICVAGNDTLVGVCGVHRIGSTVSTSTSFLADEIGYWLAASRRERGLMTGAVRVLTQYALSNLGIPVLNLQTKPGNRGSQGVARNAGYRYVGLVGATSLVDDVHDSERYVTTPADYERAFGALVPVVVAPIAPVEPFAQLPSNRALD